MFKSPWGTIENTNSGAWWAVLLETDAWQSASITGNVMRAQPGDDTGSGIGCLGGNSFTDQRYAVAGNAVIGDQGNTGIAAWAPGGLVTGNTVFGFGGDIDLLREDSARFSGNRVGSYNFRYDNPNGGNLGVSPSANTDGIDAQREFGTTYTNDLKQPLNVFAYTRNSTDGGGASIQAVVDEEYMARYDLPNGTGASVTFTVPPGSDYKIFNFYNYGDSLTGWNEWLGGL
jgi:hypothetical protein